MSAKACAVNAIFGLANVLSYHASRKVYGLWITLLFRSFFGATSLEKGSRNLLLDCSLLADDATFVLWRCINCIWGFLKCHLDKVWRGLEARYESL